jgi:hypothetical protein
MRCSKGAAALRRFRVPKWFPASATLVTFNPYQESGQLRPVELNREAIVLLLAQLDVEAF